MRKFIIIMIALVSLIGCRSQKQTADIPKEREVVRVEKVTEVKWDTVFLQVPAQSAEIITRDSTSVLETDFATSEARINPDGTLSHNLKNKPQERPQVVPLTMERNDSIVEKEISVPVYIDKPPDKMQQFKINAFWWLILISLASLAILFKKPLVNLIHIFLRF